MSDANLSALTALCRLRRVETDAARRDLGTAVSEEIALAARENALLREIADGCQISGDFDREAFSAWLGRMRDERERMGEAISSAGAVTSAARINLSQRRIAELAAKEALAGALAARDALVARREQVTLEDVSRALTRAAERSPGSVGQ